MFRLLGHHTIGQGLGEREFVADYVLFRLLSQLQPGDLVFFSDSVDPIGHVGMYTGDGYFIHASSGKGCVCITALEGSSYYINHYTGAKRII